MTNVALVPGGESEGRRGACSVFEIAGHDGDPAAGSAEIVTSGTEASIASGCIGVPLASQGETVAVTVNMKSVDVVVGVGCGFIVTQFNGVGCTETEDGTVTSGGSGGALDTWKAFPGAALILADTRSMTIEVGCNHDSAGFTMRVDEVDVLPNLVPVELQSFSAE
ncbi:MAG: hypothetical protein ACI8TX_003077 [Hyphomicrobiaceae bacterium]|jgi:hypothetical protein